MKKLKFTLLTAAMLVCGVANASTSSDGYLTDTRGNVVKSATSGLCVQTTSYNKDTTKHPDCDKIEVAPVAAPAPEEKQSYVQKVQKQFVAEVHFDFNKSELSLEDKLKLDRLVEEVKKVPRLNIQNVIVLGHADPIGKNKVNVPLSQNRANAVESYLGGRLPAVTTYALGSERNKVDCGNTATAKNIACNAENRRTKVVVNAIMDVVVQK